MADNGSPRQSPPLRLPPGGTATPLSINSGRVLDASGNVWMGPGPAPVPTGPADALPRQFDYPIGWNIYRQPANAKTADGGIDFPILREFAKQTLVRLAIETCKDLDSETDYIFTLRPEQNEKPGQTQKRAANDPRVQQVSDFFESPDGIHDFSDWRRLMWEELLIADNLSIYRWPWKLAGSRRAPYRLRIIDGDTIEPLIDEYGYEPQGDDPAFDQWIKGMARKQFTSAELLYARFNPRVKYVFGHSPTEQVLWYINILVRRDIKKLAEYTDGNIPAGLWSAPDGWTPDQIIQNQQWLDTYLSGDPSTRAKLIFVPGGARPPVFPGEKTQVDPFDDLLSRLICYAFNVSVSSLLKEQNRATAQTTKEQAEEEGVVIRRKKMTRLINRIVRWAFGYNDVIAVAKQQIEQDAAKQAEIDKSYAMIGVRQPNEIRERNGEEPIPELVDVYGYFTTNGFQTFESALAPKPEPVVPHVEPIPVDGEEQQVKIAKAVKKKFNYATRSSSRSTGTH